jgi:hypothetical protein
VLYLFVYIKIMATVLENSQADMALIRSVIETKPETKYFRIFLFYKSFGGDVKFSSYTTNTFNILKNPLFNGIYAVFSGSNKINAANISIYSKAARSNIGPIPDEFNIPATIIKDENVTSANTITYNANVCNMLKIYDADAKKAIDGLLKTKGPIRTEMRKKLLVYNPFLNEDIGHVVAWAVENNTLNK